MEKFLGRNVIEDKLRLIKKQSELYPDKYQGNLTAKFEKLGYGDLTVEPIEERWKELKSVLSGIQFKWGYEQQLKHVIINSEVEEQKVDVINRLMRVSPLISFELVRVLTDFGANVDLAITNSMNNTQRLKYLLQNGVNIYYTDRIDRWTCLHSAAMNGRTEAIKVLIDHGADVNVADKYKRTPLTEAARNGKISVVELLLKQKGIKTDVKTSIGMDAKQLAVRSGHQGIVELIKQHEYEHSTNWLVRLNRLFKYFVY